MIAIFRDPTSDEIAAGDLRVNNQVRIPFTHRGLTINNETYEVGQIAIQPSVDFVSEPKAQADGLELYEARKIQTVLNMQGVVRAASLAALHDAIDALNESFDPVLVSKAFPAGTDPDFVAPLDFDYPTADTDNYSDGLISMRYYVRSIQQPVSQTSQFIGLSAPFSLVLLVPDPRRYAQTESTASRTGTGTIVCDNSLASYPSYPTVTFALTGAGGSVSIARPSSTGYPSKTLTLDLSDYGDGDEIEVDMMRHKITDDSGDAAAAWSSGDYFELPPKSVTLTVAGTLSGTCGVAWRKAFV